MQLDGGGLGGKRQLTGVELEGKGLVESFIILVVDPHLELGAH